MTSNRPLFHDFNLQEFFNEERARSRSALLETLEKKQADDLFDRINNSAAKESWVQTFNLLDQRLHVYCCMGFLTLLSSQLNDAPDLDSALNYLTIRAQIAHAALDGSITKEQAMTLLIRPDGCFDPFFW
jgi:hypothetical protein